MLGDGVVSIEEKPNINKVIVKLKSSRSVVGDAGKKKNLKKKIFLNKNFTPKSFNLCGEKRKCRFIEFEYYKCRNSGR